MIFNITKTVGRTTFLEKGHRLFYYIIDIIDIIINSAQLSSVADYRLSGNRT